MPLDEMAESLHSMLIHIHHSLLSQQNIACVYISILAHHAHFTHCLYQGNITKATPIKQVIDNIKPIFDKIEEIIGARYQQATQKFSLLEAHSAYQKHNLPDFYSSPSPDRGGNQGQGREVEGTRISSSSDPSTTASYEPAGGQDQGGDNQSAFSTTAMTASAAASSSSSFSSSASDFMRVENVCEGMHFHLNLLPGEACPVAVLITLGAVKIEY